MSNSVKTDPCINKFLPLKLISYCRGLRVDLLLFINQQFFTYIISRTSYIQSNDDNVHFVCTRPTCMPVVGFLQPQRTETTVYRQTCCSTLTYYSDSEPTSCTIGLKNILDNHVFQTRKYDVNLQVFSMFEIWDSINNCLTLPHSCACHKPVLCLLFVMCVQ